MATVSPPMSYFAYCEIPLMEACRECVLISANRKAVRQQLSNGKVIGGVIRDARIPLASVGAGRPADSPGITAKDTGFCVSQENAFLLFY